MLALSAVTLVSLGNGSCSGDSTRPSDCGESTTNTFRLVGTQMFTAPYPNNAYIEGGAAHFDWNHDISGLCVEAADSSNRSEFTVTVGGAATSVLTMEGRIYHAAFIRPYTARLGSGGGNFFGTVENIGLRQGNPNGGSAEISTELHVSLASSGDIQSDLTRLKGLMNSIEIKTDFYRAK